MQYKNLFLEGKIGNVTLKNRVVMSPMMLGFGTFNGTATEDLINYYEERAKGGVGLIITEITRINDKTGAASFGQLSVSHDYNIASLKTMAERVHKYGTKLFVQLHHPGRQNLGMMVGTVPMSINMYKISKGYKKMLLGIIPTYKKLAAKNIIPSSVCPSKVEASYFSGGRVRALRSGEIKKLIKQFVNGAKRVQQAGCDGIELHASHGYLLQQFLSPHTNKRTDKYGGSLENRMRFLTEIISGVRAVCGKDFPIIVRLTVDEFYEKIGKPGEGYTLEEGVKMAKALDNLVDAIDVSSASYDTMNYWLEPVSFDCGWRKYLAQAVKKEVHVPVLAANVIRSAEQAEQQLSEGVQDFISLGRPLIADPNWVNKVQSGNEKLVKRCISCLYCFESMTNNAYKCSHANCSVNPFLGSENKNLIVNDGNGKQVVIVGAGPAGLTCAEILLKRGFAVTVLEKAKEVGGQLQLANKPPKKEKTGWCFTDLQSNVESLGGVIKLNTPASVEEVKKLAPYAVILATGGIAIHPRAINGADKPNVCTVSEILNGTVKLSNKTVAVIGSGMTGLETSQLLAEKGNKIKVIEMANCIAPNVWMQHLDDILPKHKKYGTEFFLNQKLIKINDGSIDIEDTATKEVKNVVCDNVVLSLGVRPLNNLQEEFTKEFKNFYVVGDALKVGRIVNATSNAFDTALKLK
ncbi:MAG: FAD-dependent oxidoreductase [Clostridia bacterium]